MNRYWLVLVCSFFLAATPPGRKPTLSCDALKEVAIPGLIVISSEALPDTTDLPGQDLKLPGHCLLRGEVNKHSGADGKAYGDTFELRMPVAWNGRLLFQGGGGLDGIVQPAIGVGGLGERPALARGYAVVSTDAGHAADPNAPMADGSFGSDPGALADYEYRSTQRVTDAAKEILFQHYGRAPAHSYFRGCSNGGREALIAMQRYPRYFDGAIAGAPAFHLTRAMIAEAWNTMQWGTLAPQLHDAFTDSDLALVARGVLAKCDTLDGVKDDLIFNPAACHYDPVELQCPGAKTESCLSSAQVNALKKVMSGALDSHGNALYSDFPYDSGIAGPGWRAWMLGNEKMPAINALIFPAAVNGMVLAGAPPPMDIFHFDFDTGAKRIDKAAPALNAESTNLAAFRSHGGKLILYTGMSDPIFSANDLIRYYRDITRANGGAAQTLSFARLFLLPGVNHCGGGPGLDSFDALTALEAWVEDGSAPDRMVARGNAFPGRTRPLCPYPQTPHYNGTGNPENAAAFFCRN